MENTTVTLSHDTIADLNKIVSRFEKVEYTKVKVLSDGDGHNYVVPSHLAIFFNTLLETDEDRFNELFSQYRTGGNINNVDLYIKAN